MSSSLLTLIPLRAITLWIFCSCALYYLTHRSPWITRVDSHLSLSSWLKHLTVVTKYSATSRHLNYSRVLKAITLGWTLPTSSYWLCTLSLVDCSDELASITSKILAAILLIVHMIHLLDLVCAHNAASKNTIIRCFSSAKYLSLVPLMYTNIAWMKLVLIWVWTSATTASF